MLVATYNAASVRARLDLILEWLSENDPDIFAIQETKVEDDKFPREDFEDLGYHVALHGIKAWNGVATLSKVEPTAVRAGFGDGIFPQDGRIITCQIDGIWIINTYVPNGNTVGSEKWDYKMKWLERFALYLQQNFRPDDKLLWLGDINIAPTPDDVYDSVKMRGKVGHHPDEFARLDRIKAFGLTDLFRQFHQGAGHYTFWDFVLPRGYERNLGWRIDHIYATEPMRTRCIRCEIDRLPRERTKPSDHTVVLAEF
ncbi:MAG: exodeoxyribonuclease III [Armatimonadetes bacterium]|nr:exodeoxyribonuclease III [Armatimonadota bacterium]